MLHEARAFFIHDMNHVSVETLIGAKYEKWYQEIINFLILRSDFLG